MHDEGTTHGLPVGVAVVGASAGGVEALKTFAAGLPPALGCPVVVVLHVSSTGTSVLPAILERAGALPATAARDGDVLEPGHLYVAPPDCHVLVTEGALRLSSGPRENGHRPAVDPTMRSAAQAYPGRTVGIVLSGTRDDGTAGMAAIKARGGRVLVQDPQEALYDSMPRSAMAHTAVDAVLPVAEIARWLGDAAAGGGSTATASQDVQASVVEFQGDGPFEDGTRFSCPDCGGVLFEVEEAGVNGLQCSIGHAYSPESFAAAQARELERALWTATRTLDDRAVLLERLVARSRRSGHERSAAAFARQAADAREHATVIRESMHRFDDTAGVQPESFEGAPAR